MSDAPNHDPGGMPVETPTAAVRESATAPARSLESSIGRLLAIGTYVSVAMVAIGVVLMTIDGISPLAAAPAFEPGRILADLVALRPAGWLWLGLVLLLATPAARVAASLVGYLRAGERAMALVSAMILLVIAIGVLSGVAGA